MTIPVHSFSWGMKTNPPVGPIEMNFSTEFPWVSLFYLVAGLVPEVTCNKIGAASLASWQLFYVLCFLLWELRIVKTGWLSHAPLCHLWF